MIRQSVTFYLARTVMHKRCCNHINAYTILTYRIRFVFEDYRSNPKETILTVMCTMHSIADYNTSMYFIKQLVLRAFRFSKLKKPLLTPCRYWNSCTSIGCTCGVYVHSALSFTLYSNVLFRDFAFFARVCVVYRLKRRSLNPKKKETWKRLITTTIRRLGTWLC